MKSTIIKRSIVLNGHRTSVSLENEFWDGLREIAYAQKTKLTELAQQVDEGRQGNNLSSAIRVFVFNHLRGQLVRAQVSAQQPAQPGRTGAQEARYRIRLTCRAGDVA